MNGITCRLTECRYNEGDGCSCEIGFTHFGISVQLDGQYVNDAECQKLYDVPDEVWFGTEVTFPEAINDSDNR